MHVHVSTDPRRTETMYLDGPQSNRYFQLFIRHHFQVPFLEPVLEAVHHSHLHPPGWDRDIGRSCGIEIVGFKRTLTAVETVIGIHPRLVRPVSSTVLSRNENSRCYRHPTAVCDMETEFSHWL